MYLYRLASRQFAMDAQQFMLVSQSGTGNVCESESVCALSCTG